MSKHLGPDLKQTRLNMSRENLVFFGGSQQFSSEICHHGWDLGPSLLTREEATIEAVERPRFSAKTVMSPGKVMASIFWDAEGMLLVDYPDKGHTITGGYYADLLRHLPKKLKPIRRGKLERGVLFHQANTPAHSVHSGHGCYLEMWIPPYSPDLAPFNYYLLRTNNWGSEGDTSPLVHISFASSHWPIQPVSSKKAKDVIYNNRCYKRVYCKEREVKPSSSNLSGPRSGKRLSLLIVSSIYIS